MKIRVISEFYDKFHTSTLYKVGTVLDFDDERAKDVIAKKLAEPYSEPEKRPEPKIEHPAEQERRKPGRPKAGVKVDAKTDEKEKAE